MINPTGRGGHFLALDEYMEELIRGIKKLYNPGGSQQVEDFSWSVSARCVVHFLNIKKEVKKDFGARLNCKWVLWEVLSKGELLPHEVILRGYY